jgi:hypothetical protein
VGDASTILRLFTDSGNAPALGLSTWDQAFLKAVYHTERSNKSEIKISMMHEIAP